MDLAGVPRQASGMAKEIPSVGDLRRKSEVTDDDITASDAVACLKRNVA